MISAIKTAKTVVNFKVILISKERIDKRNVRKSKIKSFSNDSKNEKKKIVENF
jgi:hypothetical protein